MRECVLSADLFRVCDDANLNFLGKIDSAVLAFRDWNYNTERWWIFM